MDLHDPVSDDDLDRLWAEADGELTVDEARQLQLALAANPALRAAHERIVAVRRQLARIARSTGTDETRTGTGERWFHAAGVARAPSRFSGFTTQ